MNLLAGSMRPRTWLVVWCLLLSEAMANPLLNPASSYLPTRHGGEHIPSNETDLPQDSGLSYFQHDYDPTDSTETTSHHGGLMLFHGLVMVINYTLLLPTIIVLRSNRHRLSWIFTTAFWVLNLLGWSSGRSYRQGTPDLYTGSSHGKSGTVLLLLSCVVTAVDFIPIIVRQSSTIRGARLTSIVKWARKARELVARKSRPTLPVEEYTPIIQSTNQDEFHLSSVPVSIHRSDSPLDEIDMLNSSSNFPGQHMKLTNSPTHWNPKVSGNQLHVSRHSIGSDHSTLHDEAPTPPAPEPLRVLSQRIIQVVNSCLMILERSLVPYAWGQALSGLAIYFGLGRSHYVTGVLAHFIKGSIFWWYGIMTFGRYLGAWRHWGWAWNSLPPNTETLPWSASFVESVVIFTYGFSQQFMERFGKQPGDPYSAKDVEHISIAVMFWAGGLVGMAIETPTIRRWLLGEMNTQKSRSRGKSSSGSLDIDPGYNAGSTASNPLPAVVVGITGIAMSAHHQEFQFQVQIHALWGYLLLGFAICRCLTCFFEWVRAERRMSTLPGLPPTELIGSISLGAGGIAFICSDEEITLWAMRTHRDDVMMFLNLSIALTCVAYVWCTFVLTLGGKTRLNGRRL